MPPTADIDELRRQLAQAYAVIAELRGVVADLRKQVEAQQAHIHRLVKRAFGRGGERVEGPTLFDWVDLPDAELPPPIEPPVPEVSAPKKRKGHGRRHKPADLPRRPEVIDLSDAEKVCSCCHATKIRIGQIVSERLDYQPMALFVRQLVRPTYACRSCESQGHDPQIVRAVLPPEPTPRSGIGSGLLAHVMVSKMIDHLPLHRQETTRGRSRPSPSSALCTPSNARSGRNGENRGEKFTDADVVRGRQSRAGPILAAVADWLDMQHRTATPKSLFGQAVAYARNQGASLVRHLDDARFCIDNGAAERAIRPPAV